MKKLLLLLVLLLPAPAYAAILYIATTGSDAGANNCQTIGSPCATFAYTLPKLVAGDTLYIRAGTYTEHPIFIFDGTVGSIAVNSGTNFTTGAITVSAYPGEAVVFRPTSAAFQESIFNIQNLRYWIWKDFEIDISAVVGTGDPNSDWVGGFSTGNGDGTTGYIRLQNLDIHGMRGFGSSVGFIGGSGHNELINSHLHDNNPLGLTTSAGYGIYNGSHDSLIEGNTFNDLTTYCIHSYGSSNGIDDTIIRGNTLFDCSLLVPQYAAILASAGDRYLVSNNVIDGSGGDGIQTSGGSGSKFFNNTIVNSAGRNLFIYTGGALVKNNILYGGVGSNFTDDSQTATVCSNNIGATSGCVNDGSPPDPLFTNLAGRDFTLTETSPALDTGTTLAEVTTDRIGVTRPQGSAYDIGAYERAPIVDPPGGGSGNTRTPVVTENCTGAAGALTTGYTQLSTMGTVNRDGSGKCTGDDFGFLFSRVVRSTATFSNSQYASLVFNTIGSSTTGTSYAVLGCLLSADQDSARDGYELFIYNLSGTTKTELYEKTNGTGTVIAGRTDIAWANGDVPALECTPGRVVVMKGSTVIMDVADSTHTTGKPGFGTNGDALVDDAEMGDLNVTPGTCVINIQQPAASVLHFRPATTAIHWTSQNCSGNVTIQASWNGGTTWLPLFATVAFDSSPYTWNTAIGQSATVKVRVCSGADCGTSEAFTVHGAYVK